MHMARRAAAWAAWAAWTCKSRSEAGRKPPSLDFSQESLASPRGFAGLFLCWYLLRLDPTEDVWIRMKLLCIPSRNGQDMCADGLNGRF
jgi:hypothetical protein